MANQMPLIPVSPQECTQAGYDLELLLQQRDDELEAFDETKQEHKRTLAIIDEGIARQRAIIRRARQERDEGLAHAGIALVHEAVPRE